MGNLLYDLKDLNKPFVYFHTLLFNSNTLNLAQAAGKSLEIDVSISKTGELFIGHPDEFYAFKHMEQHIENLPVDVVIELAKLADLYLVIDCKDVRALPWVKEMIEYYGVDKVAFHSWVDALLFEPYAEGTIREPHWIYEDLPYEDILTLKRETGVPVISSMRGLTKERLVAEPEIIEQIIDKTAGKIEVVNFNLPDGEIPGPAILQRLSDENLLPLLNVDHVPEDELPEVYVGISDHISRVTDPGIFASFKE